MINEASQLLVDGISEGARIALVAVGFSLIYGVTRTLHLAHGAVITLGGYLLWWCTAELSIPFPLAIVIAAAAVSAAGMAHEKFLYRRIRKPGGTNLIIVVAALGAAILVQNLIGVAFGYDTKSIREATIGQATEGVEIGSVVVPTTDIVTVVVAAALFASLIAYLRYTKGGRQIRAVQTNPALARVVGVSTPRVYLLTFALGSLISLPAAFFIGLNSGLATTIGFDAMLLGFVVAFAGGIGSLFGTLVASMGVGIIQSLSLLAIDSSWQSAFTFGLLLLVVILRPQGLFGRVA